ncbi:hypothetical protein F5888DRAFT_1870139 [Russula emetica]|nr:hypothetical protein F5888DRAFT_1870139 [Russula emetica]
MRFRDAMKLAHKWMYFTGQKKCPEPQDKDNPTHGEIEAAKEWEYEDSVASYLLSQRLPDSAVMRLSSCSSAQEQWEMVTKEYQAKSAYAQADLHQSFLEMHCAKGGDREELAAAGVHVTEKEYERTILRGIPSELATFASHILSSALIVQSTAPINIDALINQICEEADRLKSRRAHGKSGQGGKEATTEEVFAAKESEGRKRRKGKCRKCGEEGHWACECCTPKREGNATAPAAQASLGATLPPEAQHVGEAHTFLAIDFAEELWLAEEEEVAHAQMVDAELDLIWGHPKDPVADAHAQLVSAEPDLWLELDCLEDNARMQDIGMEPDPLVGNHNEDAHAQLESAELEILTNKEDGLLHQVEEVEGEGTAEVIAAVDEEKDPRVDLQGLGVSHLATLEGTKVLTFPLSQSPHQSNILRTECLPKSPAIKTGTQATRELRPGTDLEPSPLDFPLSKGAVKPFNSTVPEQIQAPTQVERPSESLWGKKAWHSTGQDSQASLCALEGKTTLGKVHGRPPDLPDSHTQGSVAMEQGLVDPKALVRMHKKRRPVLDKGASAHIDPWPGPGTIQTGSDAYFKVSALLEGEQDFIPPIADSEQAVTPKTFSFSSLPLVPLPLDTLERDLKPGEGVAAPKRHGAAQRPARLKPPDHIAEDLEKAGGAQQESAPAMLGWPQLTIAVRTGNVKAPDPCTVEAKRKAKWPPRVQATEHKHRPEWLPQEVPYRCDPDDLNGTGTCKPEDELAVLKSACNRLLGRG